MFREVNRLKGYRLGALDGEIGKVEDLFFDDQNWTVRYLVADTGYWLPDRQVLLSPHAVKHVEDSTGIVHVSLTRQQVADSPPITADQPVSRHFERHYFKYFGWPEYWAGPSLWGPVPCPILNAPLLPEAGPFEPESEAIGDPHLRSVNEITGYRLQARDGEIGHIEDALVEDRSWAIRYLMIETRNWLPGKRVLVAPPWISEVSWEKSAVGVDLTRDRIERAPDYDPASPISRDYEIALFQHYSREGYWEGDAGSKGSAP